MSDYKGSIFTGSGKAPIYYHGDVDIDKIISERTKEIQAKERTAAYRGDIGILDNGKKYERISTEKIIKNIDESDFQNVLQNHKKNSIGAKPPVRMSDKKKVQSDKAEKARVRAVAVALAIGIAVGAFGHSLSKDLNEGSEAYHYLEQYQYIVSENVHNNMSGRVDDYWYDTDQMGKEVAKSSDPQMALYKVYNGLHYQPKKNTAEVFDSAMRYAESQDFDTFAESFNNSKTFDEYVRSLGCVDKKGETDLKAYKDSMEQLALAKAMANDATKNATTISNEDKTGKGGK